MEKFVLLTIFISKNLSIEMFVDFVLLSSCGDDGRIRGWKWKENLESEVSMQGNLSFI